jgi:hypothetical protein
MKYIYYITFVSIVIVVGWIFRPVEHMSNGTCKRPIYGPVGMNGKSYPEIYGPNGSGGRGSGTGGSGGRGSGTGGSGGRGSGTGGSGGRGSGTGSDADQEGTSGEQAAMYEDDGEFSSDTATRNAAYMNVFTFKPFAKTNFPISEPPEPYLSDFANFHK